MRGRKRRWSQLGLVALATCTVVAGAYLAQAAGLLKTADYFFYDLRMNWRGPLAPSGKVVLVLMDEHSSVELGRGKGAWPRDQLATALDNLCRAGVEIVGVDLVLAAPDERPETDARLAQSIYRCDNVVLARVLSAGDGRGMEPLPAFQQSMIGDGYIDLSPDSDQVLRRVRFLNAKPHEGGGVELLPAFSLELARSFLNVEFELDFSSKESILVGHRGGKQIRLPYPELLINYVGTSDAFPHLSYADVVNNRFPSQAVAGKLAIIGSSLLLQKDFFVTPFSRFRSADARYRQLFGALVEEVQSRQDLGVSCHANAVETILSQHFIRTLPRDWVAGLAVVAGLLGMIFYLPRLRLLLAAALLAASLAGVVAAGYWVFLRHDLSVDISSVLLILSGQFVAGVVHQHRAAKRRAAQIQALFGKYVAPEVVKQLVAGDMEVSLDGQRRELTLFFSDLRGFTSLSEQLDPKATTYLLNRYFSTVLPIVFDHRGTVDKLMGDAVMAFFGAPVRLADAEAQAAETALEMLAALGSFRRSGVPGADGLHAGIGINTGEVTLGNLGSDRFMDYTVIGDAVNLASRLEGLNKVYGTEAIVSESTARRLDERFALRELDRVQVKGKGQAVTIYQLLGYRDRLASATWEASQLFGEGLGRYRARDWDRADALFGQVLQLTPGDTAAELYRQRISRLRQAALPQDWQGVTAFDHK